MRDSSGLPSLVFAAPLGFPLRGNPSFFDSTQDEIPSVSRGTSLGSRLSLLEEVKKEANRARSSLLRAAQIKPRQSAAGQILAAGGLASRQGPLFKFVLVSIFCSLLLISSGCQRRNELYKDTRVIMGTFVEVISPDQRAAQIAFNEISRIDNLLSKYKPDSEISRLNKSAKLKVSPDTMYVLQKAREFYIVSEGAFDVTVGPLVDLWGFTKHKYYLPSREEIENTLGRIGFDKIILNFKDNMVQFKVSGMSIDLGGIAKGFAVDCAAGKLKEAGIKSCLINAGGQIHCLGDKFGKPWQIAIRSPRQERLVETLQLKNKAVSTSGDYQQFFIKDKKRYSHILNPKTGEPVNSGIASVTVVAPDGLTADALSTTIFVIGKKRWRELAKKYPDVWVKIIGEDDVRGLE